MFKIARYSLLLLFTLTLSACSNEPSEQEIQLALQNNLDQSITATKELVGDVSDFLSALKTEIHNVEKIGCTETLNHTGVLCDVRLDISAPFIGRNESVENFRFVKEKNIWIVVE